LRSQTNPAEKQQRESDIFSGEKEQAGVISGLRCAALSEAHSFRSSGKAITSRMDGASVRSMTKRSMPMPKPAGSKQQPDKSVRVNETKGRENPLERRFEC
jgi:hypothetical protein